MATHAALANNFIVTSTADNGAGTLREAIGLVNSAAAGTSAAPHTITFNIASGSLTGSFGSKRALITLSTPLPAITNSYVTLDGTTQTSSTAGDTNTGKLGTTTTVGVDGLAVAAVDRPEVELSLAANNTAVLTIQGTNCTVKGLAVHGAGYTNGVGGSSVITSGGTTTTIDDKSVGAGIRLDTNANGFTITQCIIGSTALTFGYPSDGTQCALFGISIATGAGGGTISNSLIGYTGNSGIYIVNTGTSTITISGCQFNQNGYTVNGGDGITMGSSTAVKASPVVIQGNLITSPSSSGIQLEVGATSTTHILNNTLLSCGLGGSTSSSLEGSAICYLQRNTTNTGSNNDLIKRNVIQKSKAAGVVVGYNQQTVQITENQFSGNGTLSIDLNDDPKDITATTGSYVYGNGDGVTPNRNNSTVTGGTYAAVTSKSPDGGIDYPIFTTASLSGTTLTVAGYVGTATGQGTFNGATVEVYEAVAGTSNSGPTVITASNGNSDGTTVQHGELKRLLGSFAVSATGTFGGTISGVTNLTKGDVLAGTAWLSAKGTSEAGTQYTLTVTSTVSATDLTSAVIQNTAASTALLLPNGSTLALTGATTASGGSIASYTITALPSASAGTLYYNTGTTASPVLKPAKVGTVLTAANAGTLYFDPAVGYSGNAVFGYSATDNAGTTSDDNATVTIPINSPPTANNVTNGATIANTTTTTTAISALSGNDPDGTVSTFTITSLPTSGKLYYNTNTLASPSYTEITAAMVSSGYSVAFAKANYLGYVPASGFSGNAVFNYTATDNNGGVSAAATYSIPVSGTNTSTATNAAPTASDVMNANVAADAGNTSLSVLKGADTDGTIAGFTIKSLPLKGTLYFNGEVAKVGTIVLANQANLLSYTPNGQGSQTFTYTATDNQDAESNTATFTIPVSAPLPVVLVRFEAQRTGTAATLAWATASEKDSDYFAVESSTDGSTFGEVGRVASYGTTTQSHTYQLVDADLPRYGAALVYYRLRQVDLSGAVAYSAVRTVAVLPAAGAGLTAQAYPNPAATNALLQLALTAPVAGPATLTVHDALGRPVLVRQLTLEAGANSYAVPEAAQWGRGIYVLRVAQGSAHQSLKLVRE